MAKIAPEDLVGVRVYITDFHREIDAALRRIDTTKLAEFDAHIRVATYGLHRLPAYRGAVYRGATLPEHAAAKYSAGMVIQERAFVSTSADPARRFPGNVQYVIHSVNGRLVRALADDPEELEVVFFTQTRFKVLAVDVDTASGDRTVYLAEIPDPRLTVS
jgi:hypothetical protein